MEVILPSATIVLANLMSSEGELNAESKARIDSAVKLHSKHPSDVILLCGWAYRPDSSIAIADAMKSYVLAQFPWLAQKIVCQKLSRDTVGDAVFSRVCLSELFISISSFNLNVITSDYHVMRTQEIFSFVFGKRSTIRVTGAPGFGDKMSTTKEVRSLEAFRNTFSDASAGDLNSIYLSLMNNHPFYNGFIHPRIEDMSSTSLDIRKSLVSL